MYTECPNCHTFFRVGPEHLKAAGGKVRCGQCDTVFNALDTLTEALPETLQPPEETGAANEAPQAEKAPETRLEETAAKAPERDTADEAELVTSTLDDAVSELEEIFAEDEAEIAKEFGLESVDEAAGTDVEAEAAAEAPPSQAKEAGEDDDFEDWGDLDEPLPTQAQTSALDEPGSGLVDDAARPSREAEESTLDSRLADSVLSELDEEDEDKPRQRSTALWGGLIGLLGLILVGQVAYLKRDVLAQVPSLRPVVAQMCALTGCELPPLRDLAAIQIESRDVRSHPDRPGALIVNATFVNTADFVQPYPVMRLRFTDIQGKVVAERQFQPQEYLGPDIDIPRGMPPGVPVHITLEIADPGEEAVNFEFDFT